jgi:GH18 family chitinase
MDAWEIDTSRYTHVYFAFATISTDYDVVIPENSRVQFSNFLQLTRVKRILAFGGWSFSTDYNTYTIFRNAVTDANRQKFANNVAKFLREETGLDGVDFD